MIKQQFINTENKKLFQVLNKKFNLNFVQIQKLIRKGDIKINNKKVKNDMLLVGGEEIIIFLPENEIDIIYQDDNILIVNKPKKIETVSENNENDLTSLLKKKYPFCLPCHRLDFNTGGINVFALNENAYNEIICAFNEGRVDKKYFAVVIGEPKTSEILEAYLLKNSDIGKVQICANVQKNAVKIKTEYSLIEKINDELSLLEVTLHTGKTHQIRAHLAYNGLSILGDRKYGNNVFNDKYKKHTQCLVSYAISFDFSNKSRLYYLSNKIFKLKKEAKEIFRIGDNLC